MVKVLGMPNKENPNFNILDACKEVVISSENTYLEDLWSTYFYIATIPQPTPQDETWLEEILKMIEKEEIRVGLPSDR